MVSRTKCMHCWQQGERKAHVGKKKSRTGVNAGEKIGQEIIKSNFALI